MKPVIDIVDELLAVGVNVTVYNGQLDLIVDTMGKAHHYRSIKIKNEYYRMTISSCLFLRKEKKGKKKAGIPHF